jgi:hypothetical protein
LLKGKALVYGDDHLEPGGFGGGQEISVLETSKFYVPRSLAIVIGKEMPQTLINALVDEESHQTRASKSCFASSNARRAASRETVGNPVRKSSRVSPPSR